MAQVSGANYSIKTKNFLSSMLAALAVGLFPGSAWAQSSEAVDTGSVDAGTVDVAFQTARQAVAPEVRTNVVSVYGIGTPGAIQKWYIIFYDPTLASHGRAVLVEDNQIVKTYPANLGPDYPPYSKALSFDPSRITNELPALNAAHGYAAKHGIAYDSVRVLLKQISLKKPFRWRVELLDIGKSRGYVYVNALDDSVAAYSGASSGNGSSSGPSNQTAAGFANDVKKTFLGIGGDLEEFFTGERTVDK